MLYCLNIFLLSLYTGTDNLSRIKTNNILLTLFLLPGRIIQWFLYIFVAGKGYGKVRMQSRLARSPIMTYIYSILSWIVIIYFVQITLVF